MRKILILGCLFVFIAASCSPTVPATPAVVPTHDPTKIVENPPACWGADFLYHPQLQQMLLINCVMDPRRKLALTIWGWDGTQWQRVAQGGPSGRILGGAAYDEKRNVLVVYGGRPVELGRCSRATWEWDGKVWEQKEVQPPTACDHVKMVYDAARGETILFSGLDPAEIPVHETWSWDGKEWKLLSEDGPESRGHFGFVYDPSHEQTLLYGGYTSSATDDFWIWKDEAWQEINFSGPGTLSHFGMTYDTDQNALVIFGGATTRSTFTSLTDKTWILRDGRWQELNTTDLPSERGSPSMGYDPVRERVVLYGGFDAGGNILGDTWEWDGQQWTCLANCE